MRKCVWILIAAWAAIAAFAQTQADNEKRSNEKAGKGQPPVRKADDQSAARKQDPAKSSPQPDFMRQVFQALKVDPGVFQKMSAVRGGNSGQLLGIRIMRADLAAQTETLVSECVTPCWSLMPVGGDRLAVLKADGIWAAPVQGGELNRILEATDLARIIGQPANETNALLVAARTGSAQCEFRLEMADLSTGKRQPMSSLSGCLTEGDLGAMWKPAALRSGHYLTTSESGPRPLRLLIGSVEREGDGPPPPNRELLTQLKGANAGVSRVDPVWLTGQSVAYLQGKVGIQR